MRILLCCADWGVPLGGCAGSSVHVRAMARALSGLGHEVRLVVTNADGPSLPPQPVTIVANRLWWPTVRDGVEGFRAQGDKAPHRAPATESGGHNLTRDAAQATAAYPGAQGASSLKTRLYYDHLPRWIDRFEELVWHRRRFESAVGKALVELQPHGVYERHALGQTGTSRALTRLGHAAPPHLLEVNASLADERTRRGHLPGFLGRLAQAQEAWQWRRADRVFCVSGALAETLARNGVAAERIEVAPNGVDITRFTPDRPKGFLRSRLGCDPQAVLVGYVGSLAPGRGAEEFLDIIAKTLPLAPHVHGVVAGDGPLSGELRRQARTLGLDGRLDFLGAVPHDLVPEVLVDLDIALACYPAQQGFYFSSMKLLEYMACGLATVCSRAGQMGELIEDGVCGILVEPGAAQIWAETVAALSRDAALRTSLGVQARRRALAGPTWEKNAGRVVEVIEALAARRNGVGRP